MAKKIKNKTIALVTALVCATSGMGAVTASAFNVSGARYQGAPSNTGSTEKVIVMQRANGATATVSSCSNSNGSGTVGNTIFVCENYTMTTVTITGMGSKPLNPSVGSPTVPISVIYRVSASSAVSENTYYSSGSITAN